MRLGPVLVTLALGLPQAASAEAPAGVAKADQLFHEGLALKESDVGQACAKFEESLRYNAQAIGTLLNVALCDEKLGRIASAVAKFSEARDRAREQNLPEHLAAAEERIGALTPDLPHLTLKLTEPAGPDTRILIDDKLLPLDQIVDHPVDPGDRVIVVTAPGRIGFRATLRIARRERKDLMVPRLANSVSSRRTIGKLVAAGGGVTLGVGIALGLVARSRYNSVIDECRDQVCWGENHAKTESARTIGNVGTVVGIVGIGAIAVGSYLWLRSPRAERATVSVVPQIGTQQAGLFAIGSF